MYRDSRANRIELETGVTGDRDPGTGERWIEVTNWRDAGSEGSATTARPWTPIDGTEQMILGDLSILMDGDEVKLAKDTDAKKAAGRAAVSGATKGGSSE